MKLITKQNIIIGLILFALLQGSYSIKINLLNPTELGEGEGEDGPTGTSDPMTQISNNEKCQQKGVPGLADLDYTPEKMNEFRYALNLGPNKEGNLELYLPYFSSLPLDKINKKVTNIHIMNHGLSAQANQYFCLALRSLDKKVKEGTYIVVSPWFGNQSVSADVFAPGKGYTENMKSTKWFSWSGGKKSSPIDAGRIHSFDAYDRLLEFLTSGNFPNLMQISMAGFSAGGQFMNRYSMTTAWGGKKQPKTPKLKNQVNIRFIIANPGSYFYLSPERPAPSCRPAESTTDKKFKCTEFKVPKDNDPYATLPNFSKYNDDKYGLGDDSKALFDNYDIVNKKWKEEYLNKDVYLVIGAEDFCNCGYAEFKNSPKCSQKALNLTCSGNKNPLNNCCDTYPDGNRNVFDVSGAGMTQGTNRFQRALNYRDYMNFYYKNPKNPLQFTIVDGMAHNNVMFVTSDIFKKLA